MKKISIILLMFVLVSSITIAGLGIGLNNAADTLTKEDRDIILANDKEDTTILKVSISNAICDNEVCEVRVYQKGVIDTKISVNQYNQHFYWRFHRQQRLKNQYQH